MELFFELQFWFAHSLPDEMVLFFELQFWFAHSLPDGKTPKVSPLSNRGVRALASTPGHRCSQSMHPEGCAPLIGPSAWGTLFSIDAKIM